ncbi:MAG: hypothetical protein GVY27_08980 [Deinococcus-Thermus bacterium]|nr:hypothetical protein [Deinococcota bacterium]
MRDPLVLDDASASWRLLAEGAVRRRADHRRAGDAAERFDVVDDWTDRLDAPIDPAFQERGGALTPVAARRLAVGGSANRSAQRWRVGGSDVYVPTSTPGGSWRVSEALEFLAAALGLPLQWRAVGSALTDRELAEAVPLTGTLDDALASLLEQGGARLARLDAATLAVVDDCTARRVRLPLAAGVVASRVEQRNAAATRWIARGGRNAVEATFDLAPAWDPALESADDAAYDRSQSGDFATYRDVFRRWVLNEDGGFSGSPFDAGPAPDLGALFANPSWTPRPLRFGDTLTPDDAGRRQPPLVELSDDGGATWSGPAGRFVMLDDRAGLYLDDDALDASWLTAVRAGSARLRVTATLTDPRPLTVERWDGNPFAGSATDRALDAGEGFRRLRVDGSSVLGQAANSDASIDRTAALRDWLDRMLAEREARDVGRVDLALPGVGFGALATGDLVDLRDQLSVEAGLAPGGRWGRIDEVVHRFADAEAPETRLGVAV